MSERVEPERVESRSGATAASAAFEPELQRIRDLVLTMGDQVDRAMTRATGGLVDRDVDVCTAVIRDDARINALLVEVREVTFTAIAHASAPELLRGALGLLHMASELERMGDHCASIAKSGRELADLPPLASHFDLPQLSEACEVQVRDILSALIARDVDRARAIAARDDRVNRIHHRIVDDLIQLMTEDGDAVYRGTKLIMVAQNFERIGDRVTNLAEDLIFLETGRIEELG
ncbi:MAG: phosphate signaling complex protein PhoU [Candidatus Dormibacteria bacterium]